MWSFIEVVQAARDSKIRFKGTPEVKTLKVTRNVDRKYILEKLFPSNREKFSTTGKNQIIVQKDNNRPQVNNYDPEFVSRVIKGSWNFLNKQHEHQTPRI